MTEQEWLASEDPAAMLRVVGVKASDRKLGLFFDACWSLGYCRMRSRQGAADDARHMVHCVSDPPNRHLAPTVASFMRDIVGNPFRPVTLCGLKRKPFHNQFAHVDANDSFWLESECPACRDLRTPTVLSLAQAAYDERPGRKCGFCKGKGHFQTSGSYSECPRCPDKDGVGTGRVNDGTLDPARLAVLSDALEEAGCDDQELLLHLRSWRRCEESGPHGHVRGCWALDLILGRE